LVIGTLLLTTWGEGIVDLTGRFMKFQLENAGPLVMDRNAIVADARGLATALGGVLLPILTLLVVGAIVVNLFQVGFLFTPERLLPDPSRLSPAAGIKRIVSLSGVMKLGFGLFKVIIVAVVAGTVIFLRRDQVLYASSMSIPVLAHFIANICLSTAFPVLDCDEPSSLIGLPFTSNRYRVPPCFPPKTFSPHFSNPFLPTLSSPR
jgi:flagellar biosynthetic protein FlhB